MYACTAIALCFLLTSTTAAAAAAVDADLTTTFGTEFPNATFTQYGVNVILAPPTEHRTLAFGLVTSSSIFKLILDLLPNELRVNCWLKKHDDLPSDPPFRNLASQRFAHDDFLLRPNDYSIDLRLIFGDSESDKVAGLLPDEARLVVDLKGPDGLNMTLDDCTARLNRTDAHAFVTTTTTFNSTQPRENVKTYISVPAAVFKGQNQSVYITRALSITRDPEDMTKSVPGYQIAMVGNCTVLVEHGVDGGKTDPEYGETDLV
ncbi:hypothetical protein RI367_002446 [Sorochytrium milnesiophthora]